jgi:hypothetical protein
MKPDPSRAPTATPEQIRKSKRLLAICVLTVVLSSLLTSLVQSSFGKVDVYSIKVPTQNGQWLVADLFKPKSATKDNPAPLVVVVPGFRPAGGSSRSPLTRMPKALPVHR